LLHILLLLRVAMLFSITQQVSKVLYN